MYAACLCPQGQLASACTTIILSLSSIYLHTWANMSGRQQRVMVQPIVSVLFSLFHICYCWFSHFRTSSSKICNRWVHITAYSWSLNLTILLAGKSRHLAVRQHRNASWGANHCACSRIQYSTYCWTTHPMKTSTICDLLYDASCDSPAWHRLVSTISSLFLDWYNFCSRTYADAHFIGIWWVYECRSRWSCWSIPQRCKTTKRTRYAVVLSFALGYIYNTFPSRAYTLERW